MCNCTLCHRYGGLWLYGHDGETVRMTGETRAYVRTDEPEPAVEIRFCPTCGNLVGWRGLRVEDGRRRMAVNVRLAEPEAVANLPVKHLDGRGEWTHELRGQVRDMWF